MQRTIEQVEKENSELRSQVQSLQHELQRVRVLFNKANGNATHALYKLGQKSTKSMENKKQEWKLEQKKEKEIDDEKKKINIVDSFEQEQQIVSATLCSTALDEEPIEDKDKDDEEITLEHVPSPKMKLINGSIEREEEPKEEQEETQSSSSPASATVVETCLFVSPSPDDHSGARRNSTRLAEMKTESNNNNNSNNTVDMSTSHHSDEEEKKETITTSQEEQQQSVHQEDDDQKKMEQEHEESEFDPSVTPSCVSKTQQGAENEDDDSDNEAGTRAIESTPLQSLLKNLEMDSALKGLLVEEEDNKTISSLKDNNTSNIKNSSSRRPSSAARKQPPLSSRTPPVSASSVKKQKSSGITNKSPVPTTAAASLTKSNNASASSSRSSSTSKQKTIHISRRNSTAVSPIATSKITLELQGKKKASGSSSPTPAAMKLSKKQDMNVAAVTATNNTEKSVDHQKMTTPVHQKRDKIPVNFDSI